MRIRTREIIQTSSSPSGGKRQRLSCVAYERPAGRGFCFMKALQLTGLKFGRLTVIKQDGKLNREIKWLCQCVCGGMVSTIGSNIKRGITKSCGCLQRNNAGTYSKTHGEGGQGNTTPEYRSWCHLKNRCQNPNNAAFRFYGGRGITVCESWSNSFESFLKDMGRKPSSKHSIDRIDVNGNYEPSNCRWATQMEQSMNKRNTIQICAFGKTMTTKEWAQETGIFARTIRYRINSGWNAEIAVTALPHDWKVG